MKEVHNQQVALTQIPRVQKLAETQEHLIPNGNQVLNVEIEKERKLALSQVKDLEDLQKSEKEEAEKRRIKKRERDKKENRKKKGGVDLYG